MITPQKIIRSLEKSIKERIPISINEKLIIHLDQGTQFSSKSYNTFVIKHNQCMSRMARENIPTYNLVAEKFMSTFREHKIYDTTIEEVLSNHLAIESNFISFRAVLNKYVRSLNSKKNLLNIQYRFQ